MAYLVVDAAYVHVGARRAKHDETSDLNGWSSRELKALRPRQLRRRLEAAFERRVVRSVWCGARDGRMDSGGKELERSLNRAGFETSFSRIKVDEVVCRNRDCCDAKCPHRGPLSTPVRVRRQAGVDVDIACRALEMLYSHSASDGAPALLLVAGDGDFAPLARAVHRAGATLLVAAWSHSLSPDLEAAADGLVYLDSSFFIKGPGADDDDEEEEDVSSGRSSPRSSADASSSSSARSSPFSAAALVPAQVSLRQKPRPPPPPPPPPPEVDVAGGTPLERPLRETIEALPEPARCAALLDVAVLRGLLTDEEAEDLLAEDDLASDGEPGIFELWLEILTCDEDGAPPSGHPELDGTARHPELGDAAISPLRHPELDGDSDDDEVILLSPRNARQ